MVWYEVMCNSKIRFTETFNIFKLFTGLRQSEKRIVIFRSLLLSNMQICYPR